MYKENEKYDYKENRLTLSKRNVDCRYADVGYLNVLNSPNFKYILKGNMRLKAVSIV